MREIEVKSSLDGSREKNLLHVPEGRKNFPLVVGLHSWSAERSNQEKHMLPHCVRLGWGLLLPEFRGPNLAENPRACEACGSLFARQDIADATRFVLANYSVDPEAVVLLGGSGGGHMALLAGPHAPELWRLVSAWCPITDLALWRRQREAEWYWPHLDACCGGAPDAGVETAWEYAKRSPLAQAENLLRVKNLYLHHGRHDSTVPCVHSQMLAAQLEAKRHPSFYFELYNNGHHLEYARAFDYIRRQLSGADESEIITG